MSYKQFEVTFNGQFYEVCVTNTFKVSALTMPELVRILDTIA